MSAKAQYPHEKPQIPDETLARLRAAAHRFVLAGGSLFLYGRETDISEYISTTNSAINGEQDDNAFVILLAKTVPDHAQREALWSVVSTVVTNHQEAGFLFGALVGLELAALPSGPRTAVSASDAVQSSKKS